MFRRSFIIAIFAGLLLIGGSAQATVTCDLVTGATSAPSTFVYVPDITFPGFGAGQPVTISSTTLAEYIRSVFIVFIWAVGVLAVVMTIYGGIKWVAAAGDAGRINDAKDVITNAIIGLIIALTSVLLLQTINPNLIAFDAFNVKGVSKCTFSYIRDVVQDAGVVTDTQGRAIDRCPNTSLYPDPDGVCFATPGQPCIGDLSRLITAAAKFTRNDGREVNVDPVLMKALILGESARQDQNTLLSGPTRGKACSDKTKPSCQKNGSAYGIIQMIQSTLVTNWQLVEGSVPAECTGDNARAASGSLAPACARYLDNGQAGVLRQLKLMASEISNVMRDGTISTSPTYIAAAYHLGKGGAMELIKGESSPDESRNASVAYIKAFNQRYQSECKFN